MRLLSWNVNGLRAIIKKGFTGFLKKERPDILGLQEIKISDVAREKEIFDFAPYQEFWNCAVRPGYSGTAVLVKDGIKVLRQVEFPGDDEGRVLILEMEKFYFASVYFINAKDDLSRLGFKIEWNDRLLKFLKKLEGEKPLVVGGDYNVAHEEIDLARPRENLESAGFSAKERSWMSKFLKSGFVDTFRGQNPKKVQYSWWSFRAGARARNVGWRIDYFCVSDKIFRKVSHSFIMDKIQGSDHCPVGIELEIG